MIGTILDSIIERKKVEVEELKAREPKISVPTHPTRSFVSNLKTANHVAIISEFKRASPSKGNINLNLDPESQAKLYKAAGASAISVLTDEKGFKGTFSDLEKVRDAVDLPILCKDFIIDPIQVDFARRAGADLILLIAGALSLKELASLYSYASSMNLECLVEIHDESDLKKALEIEADLIGINNRDLKTFDVNLHQTEKLGPLVRKEGALLISESGIRSREDVLRAAAAGANGILVGETFMKSTDLIGTFSDLIVPNGGEKIEG